MAQNSHKKTSVQRMARSTRRIGYLVSFGALLFGFGFLAWRLYDIQVINGDYWRGLASVQQLKDTTLQAVRGEIYDSTGKTLASTSIVWDVSCDPKNSKGLYTTVAETGESYLNEAICSEVCAGIARILVANDGTRGEAVDVKSPEYLEQYQYLYERFSRITSQYRLLAGRVDMPVANAIDAYVDEFNKAHTTKERTMALIVSITKTYKRDYPYGAFAAAVLGFCDDSGAGVYGLEKSYNEQLAGMNGRRTTIMNAFGAEVDNDQAVTYAAQDGYNLHLTLDNNIQEIVERYLNEAVYANTVENRGCAIVMNVKTGAVYAMATKPDFDPNQPYVVLYEDYFAELVRAESELYGQWKKDENGVFYTDNKGNKIFDETYDYTGTYRAIQWKNKAITELYYPGSVFKVITAAAGLDSGYATLQSANECKGYYAVADHVYHCANKKTHGEQEMALALRNSCNIYFIELGQRLGPYRFYDYYNAFGFTEPTGVDLPYEMQTSQHYTASQMGDTELASSAFGQAMAITPLQMCTALAACVNGGYLVTPYLVDRITDASGNVVQETTTTVKRQVVSETVSQQLNYILEYEVGDGTTTEGGYNAYVAGYRIGGKSGTSEQLNMDRREDGDYKKVASFAAMLPADDPEILVYVMLDDPNNAKTDYSSILAAPVVGNIISEVAPYLGLSTDGNDLTKTTVKVPNLVGKEWSNAQVSLNRAGLKHRLVEESGVDNTAALVTYQYPYAGTRVAGGTTVYIYTSDSGGRQVTTPGVEGKPVDFAQQMLSAAGLNCIIEGDANGVVLKQSVATGRSVEMGTVVTLTCGPAVTEPASSTEQP